MSYGRSMRRFNVTGLCVPGKHYMADTSEKLAKIMRFVEQGDYFPINRGRQYGKTTTLALLEKRLPNKKFVLMIDEVDKASNNIIFLKFLGILRDKFLHRNDGSDHTFQSVILAGVYDIKNLKLKMVQAGTHKLQDGEKRINSPWNIAIDFNVDMSLNEKEIASMLMEYENDHKRGMDIEAISKEIRAYTSGYPYLVSRICQNIDENLGKPQAKWMEYKGKKIFDCIVGV